MSTPLTDELARELERKIAPSEVGVHGEVEYAHFGSASFRNQHRAGLRIAYIESAWRWPGNGGGR